MKSFLLAGALMLGGTAFAQSAPMQDTPPPPADPTAAPMPADPNAAQQPMPDAAPMPAPAGPQQPRIVWKQPATVEQAFPPPPPKESYPRCSKAVQDSCRNPGGK